MSYLLILILTKFARTSGTTPFWALGNQFDWGGGGAGGGGCNDLPENRNQYWWGFPKLRVLRYMCCTKFEQFLAPAK